MYDKLSTLQQRKSKVMFSQVISNVTKMFEEKMFQKKGDLSPLRIMCDELVEVVLFI